VTSGAPVPDSAKARQDALTILMGTLTGDAGDIEATLGSCDTRLVSVALALMLIKALSAQDIDPAGWVAEMRARPPQEPGPANGLAWQN
jgi:hypothetical protein